MGSIPLSIVSENKTDQLLPFEGNLLVRYSMRQAEGREINWERWQQILDRKRRTESPSPPSFTQQFHASFLQHPCAQQEWLVEIQITL